MNRGFSLIEVLIVVVIAATLVLVVGNFGTNVSSLNGLINVELESKSDVAQQVQIMASEIRSAEPSAAGAYPVDSASTSSFAFYSDINQDGIAEHVRYFLASSTIYRGVIAPTGTPATYPAANEVVTDVVDHVALASSTPLFSYYGSSYAGTGSPLASPVAVASVRVIAVTFYAALPAKNTSQPAAPQYFSTVVDLRNLDSN